MDVATPPSLLSQVHCVLSNSPYLSSDTLLVETAEDGIVRLQGQVGTFFQKQMAQELVRRVDGVQRVENGLRVSW
jgi:osmotically-inducible protein OsmY